MVAAGAEPLGGFLPHAKGSWDEPDSHRFLAHCTTAADGRFRFIYNAPGAFDLRVRCRTSAPHPPVRVEVARAGEAIERRIDLPGARVTGRFAGPRSAGDDLSAHLYRLDEADEDPYFYTDYSMPKSSRVIHAPLDARGGFSLDHLPAGRWVLRFGSFSGGAGFFRVIETSGDRVLDLGDVGPPALVDVALVCRLPALPKAPVYAPFSQGYGVSVRSIAPGRPKVFVAAQRLDAKFTSKLPAGRYELELFEVFHVAYWTTRSVSGNPTGRRVTFEVKPDGSTVPEQLDFR
jgi:hypothetical protein